MIGKTERVVLVKGDASKWYEQAIFIVNTNTAAEMPVDFVAEAERIINEFNLKKQTGAAPSHAQTTIIKAKPQKSFKLHMLMIFGCIVIAAILAFGLLR